MDASRSAPAGAEAGAAQQAGAPAAPADPNPRNLDRLAEALRRAPGGAFKTNRERYLGPGRIMQLQAAFIHYSGMQAQQAALAQARALARAQAWDAWVESCGGPMRRLRGVPGGVLPLAALERMSRGFRDWLDAPAAGEGGPR